MSDNSGNKPFQNNAQTMTILHLIVFVWKIYSTYNKCDVKAKENFLGLKICILLQYQKLLKLISLFLVIKEVPQSGIAMDILRLKYAQTFQKYIEKCFISPKVKFCYHR